MKAENEKSNCNPTEMSASSKSYFLEEDEHGVPVTKPVSEKSEMAHVAQGGVDESNKHPTGHFRQQLAVL